MSVDKTRCAVCGVRNHALGGRASNGEFMLALPVNKDRGGVAWPRLGIDAWCANADGEVQRLSIVRIALTRTILNQAPAFLCQHCLRNHQASQGIFLDLFAVRAA
ncbi:MAG TPA: hypothetical protein VGF56_05865 [Rhizomicrobium sp.]|jgi:hypothetical protein